MPLNWPQCGVWWLGWWVAAGQPMAAPSAPQLHTLHSSPLTATQFLAVGRAPPHLVTGLRPILIHTHHRGPASQHLIISACQHPSILASQQLCNPASQYPSIPVP